MVGEGGGKAVAETLWVFPVGYISLSPFEHLFREDGRVCLDWSVYSTRLKKGIDGN